MHSSGFRSGMQFGKYSVSRQIGHRSDSTQYLAQVSGSGGPRVCVLEEIPTADEDIHRLRESLEQEARVAITLNHPNLVKVFEYGEVNGLYFISKEYVEGRTLSDVLETLRSERARFNLPAVLALGLAISDALDYIHRGVRLGGKHIPILYRNLNPQNILVSSQGFVKMINCSIFRPNSARPASIRQSSSIAEAPENCGYMAPEQIMGLNVDERADVFSLGVILAEMLLGQPLFTKPQPGDTVKAVLGAQIPPFHTLRPDLPGIVDQMLQKALSRRLEQRYATARAFYNDLLDLASNVDMSPAVNDLASLANNQLPMREISSIVARPRLMSSTNTAAIHPLGFPEVDDPDEGNALIVWIALATAAAVAGAVFFVLRFGA